MRNFYRCALIINLAIYLTGCSTLDKINPVEQRHKEYLAAQSSQPLQVPVGMSSTNIHEDFPVPNANVAAPPKPVSILPPNSLAEQIKQGKLTAKELKAQETLLRRNIKTMDQRPPRDINNGTNNGTNSVFKNNTLVLNQSVVAAWSIVEDALTKAGYPTVLKNPNTQIFYILDTFSTNGAVTKETPIYQIHLRTIALGTEIYVADNTGKRASLEDANRILDNIYSKLPKSKPREIPNNPVDQSVTPNANPSATLPSSNFGRLLNSLFNR